jgi:hypothetical protein
VGYNSEPFAIAGDSGSLVVTEDGTATVGLIFAASGQYGCFTPLKYILQELGGGELVGGHEIPSNTDESNVSPTAHESS